MTITKRARSQEQGPICLIKVAINLFNYLNTYKKETPEEIV